MPGPRTSPTLLDRLKDTADDQAWAQFESVYGDLIVAFCRRRGVQPADAEDVKQLVTLKLMRAVKSFEYDRSKGRFRDYLLRVTQSVLADRAPRDAIRPLDSAVEREVAHAGPSPTDGAGHIWHQEWEAFHFRRAWAVVQAQFSSEHLDVFNRLLGGDAVRRVAESSGLSEEAVHKVKQRVRDRLKSQIAAQVAEEDGG